VPFSHPSSPAIEAEEALTRVHGAGGEQLTAIVGRQCAQHHLFDLRSEAPGTHQGALALRRDGNLPRAAIMLAPPTLDQTSPC
jgi:hypothetical protein